MKVGDLVEIPGAPERGYGLVISYDKGEKVFEVHFSEYPDTPYYCTDDAEYITVIRETKNDPR